MPNQQASAVYHLARNNQIPKGQLLYVDERPEGQSDIYLHPLHARHEMVWNINWLTGHLVGHGLWQQRWTHEGRMQEPPEGLGIAVSRWEIVPAHAMPRRRFVMSVEEQGSCIWLIREGYCTKDLRDAMNAMLERIAGDGLWIQYWDEHHPRPEPGGALTPALAPGALQMPM